MDRVMDRGDIYKVSLDPGKGREQAGWQYVLIVSTWEFNQLGTPLVCPITQGGNLARDRGFAVSLSGTATIAQGVVRCNQPRVLDLQSRGAGFVEKVPPAIIDEVMAKLQTLLQYSPFPKAGRTSGGILSPDTCYPRPRSWPRIA